MSKSTLSSPFITTYVAPRTTGGKAEQERETESMAKGLREDIP